LTAAVARRNEFDSTVDNQKGMVQQLLQQRILLNQQLQGGAAQNVFQHNQLVAQINMINDQLRLIDSQAGDPRFKQGLDKEVGERRSAYIQAVLDLRKLVDSITERYAELARDETIKVALVSLGSKSKPPPKLGPSRGFEESVKQLQSREKSVLSKEIELRRRGLVYEVDVTFNGRQTTPMIFDTGAELVLLSTDFADKIGLHPQASDPTIELHDASGGVTPAKKMSIPSMSVGPFTAHDVDCAIMPAGKRDVPLLLGQSFISQFAHRVDNGRLVLSNVEPAEPAMKVARPRPKATKSKRSSKASSATVLPAAPVPDAPH
jgi:clan AA aspartic protease (TIGR02281 family)